MLFGGKKNLYLINNILGQLSACIYEFFLIFDWWFQKQQRNITDLVWNLYFLQYK